MSMNFTAITDSKPSETEFVGCECCRMTEEYTVAHIGTVRNLYAGRFICGLCSEAVKYEILCSGKKQRRIIGIDEALAIHMRFCDEFVTSPSPTVDLISTIEEMFRRRLILNLQTRVVTSAATESPRILLAIEGGENCAAAVIGGDGSCLHALSGGA